MNNLLEELEALRISGDFSEDNLWAACNDLVEKTFVPEKTVAANRPCEEKDFREYRQIVDRNLQNIRSMLQHILYSRNEGNSQIYTNAPIAKTCTINLLLLIGEHHEKNVWNTAESVSISKELINIILKLHISQSISQLLIDLNFTTVLLTLRPKLLINTWKTYPAAVACYKWLLFQIEKPGLHNYIFVVLPTALIIIDDFVPENVVIGLECLHQTIEHSHLRKWWVETGYDEVFFDALKRLTYQREPKYVILVYSCIASLLATREHWDIKLNMFAWTKRDDVLLTLLDNMELEQNVELRRVYMLSLPQLLTNIGCAKWCERLVRILVEYCEHHTDVRTLKATLETAKTFLLIFHLRVAAHCVPLYRAFLKLHLDLVKTPVFDKEIMQNLEDCMRLFYKLSPNIGCVVMNDERIQSVIKNSLEVVCLGDTKYFQ